MSHRKVDRSGRSATFVPMEAWQFDFSKWYNHKARTMPSTYVSDVMYRDMADLKRLAMAIDGIVTNIAKEEIICRRKGHQTERHAKLVADFNQALEGLDQAIFMFKLTHC